MLNNLRTKKNTSPKKVFVGLSGGVDSAVSAALLVRAGYDVTGVFIRIVLPGYPCPAVTDRQDAMRVAAHLKIPFRDIDLSKQYEERVFKHTLEEYARGRTPNPDVLCNREIKFGLFFEYAMREGATYVATGHYARTKQEDGHTLLYTGNDTAKDQSYFLWMVPETQLAKTLFPVGALQKSQVRALALKFGLPNATRKDSQGLCFLGAIAMDTMLTRELHPLPGDVVSEDGHVIGCHNGALLYTLGQRHGFIVQHRSPDDQRPLYVIAKDTTHNTITVSAQAFPPHASKTSISLTSCNWIGPVSTGTGAARYRYRQALIKTHVRSIGDTTTLELLEPQYVPAGQSLVVYLKDRCLGGGVVDKSIPLFD